MPQIKTLLVAAAPLVKVCFRSKARNCLGSKICSDNHQKIDKKKSMADEFTEQDSPAPSLLRRVLSKRRTWVCLFISVYGLLLSFSWNLLHSILDWYNSTTSSTSPTSFGWPALYASMLFGGVFGLLSMAAALAVAIPATVVTWITILVLLTFAGKPRTALVLEGRKITKDILGFVMRIVIREGNIVAVLCAVVGYFALVGRNGEED